MEQPKEEEQEQEGIDRLTRILLKSDKITWAQAEYMHSVCLGVVKRMCTLFSNVRGGRLPCTFFSSQQRRFIKVHYDNLTVFARISQKITCGERI